LSGATLVGASSTCSRRGQKPGSFAIDGALEAMQQSSGK
jgi:hypothetical protein